MSDVKKREFKVEVTEGELKKIRKAKADIGVETSKELIFTLIAFYYKMKGGAIL